eukprot:5900434-Lingulodinium_polyedra.AAC.1
MRTPERVQPWGPTRCRALPPGARRGPGVWRLHVGPPGERVQKAWPPGLRGLVRSGTAVLREGPRCTGPQRCY